MAAAKTGKKPTSKKPKAPKDDKPKDEKKPKEEKSEPTITITEYSKQLLVALGPDEQKKRAQELADAIEEHDQMEAEHKDAAKHNKALLSEKNTEIRRISMAVKNGNEARPVKCERRMDYARKRVIDVRMDTGEVIEERDMNQDELQKKLFKEEADIDSGFGEAPPDGDDGTGPEAFEPDNSRKPSDAPPDASD